MKPLSSSSGPAAVQAFVAALKSRTFNKMPELFASGAIYWVQGRPPVVPYGGPLSAAIRLPQLSAMLGGFTTFHFEIKVLFGADDEKTAALMAEVHGEGPGDKRYDNDVAMIFRLDDAGLIQSLSEYLDNDNPMAFFSSHDIPARSARPGSIPLMTSDVDSRTTRDIVDRYISAISSHDFSTAVSLFDPDAQFWLNGRIPVAKYGGWMAPKERLSIIQRIHAGLRDISTGIDALIVDGPQAVAQITSTGTAISDGSVFMDSAALVFATHSGLITELREYGDHVSAKLP